MAKTKLKIAAGILALACLGSMLAISNNKHVNTIAEECSMVEIIEFESIYSIGQTIKIPDGTIVVGEKQYPATKVVYKPSGGSFIADSIVLNESGQYVVEYRVEVDGRLYKKTYSFAAEDSLYSVTSNRSQAVYGTDLDWMMQNYTQEDYTGISGINVSLANGDEFTYNQVIDLSDNDENTTLLSIMAIPSRGSKFADCNHIYFRLTDAYDEDNYVDIKIRVNYSGFETSTNPLNYTDRWCDYYLTESIGENGETVYLKTLGTLTNAEGIPVETKENGAPADAYAGQQLYITRKNQDGSIFTDESGNAVRIAWSDEEGTPISNEGIYAQNLYIPLKNAEGALVKDADGHPIYAKTNPARSVWFQSIPKYVYVSAAANGQKYKGIEGSTLHIANNSGAPAASFFWATEVDYTRHYNEMGTVLGEQTTLRIYYDSEERAIYTYDNNLKRLVIDLDDMTYQDSAFKGFTTGEVFLSMNAKDYLSNSFNCVIRDIDGQDLTKSQADSSKVKLDIDTSAYGSEPMKAVVGQPFKLFTARAKDIYHQDVNLQVAAKVYKNYCVDGGRISVPVVNGCFIPDSCETYTIEYSVVGNNGQKYIKTLDIPVVENDPLKVAYGVQLGGKGGEWIDCFTTVAENAIGNAMVEYIVLNAQGEKVSVKDGRFRAGIAGEYTVTARLVDYVGRTAEHTETCEVSVGEILLTEEISLNDYYLTGIQYTLPQSNAYDYENMHSLTTTVKVNDDNGERILNADNKVTFAGNFATISYLAGDTLLLFKEIQLIDAISGRDHSMEKYFVASEGLSSQVAAGQSSISLVADGTQSKVSAKFVNTLSADGFSLIVGFPAETMEIDAFSIILTDKSNASQTLKFSIRRDDYTTKDGVVSYVVYINGNRYPYQKTSLTTKTLADKRTVSQLELNYDNSLLTIYNENFTKDLHLLDKGDFFEGFSSGEVLFTIEMEGVVEGSTLDICSLVGQNFSAEKADKVKPTLILSGEYGSNYSHGAILSVAPAIGLDVLDGVCAATVSVFSQKTRQYVKDVNGTLLQSVPATQEYQVELTEYGDYIVVYQSYDLSRNKEENRVTIYVMDREKPILNVNGGVNLTAKINEELTLPTANATDNVDDGLKVYCLIIDESGHRVCVEAGTNYTFGKKGKYTLRYFVIDTSGNLVQTDIIVVVE